MISGLTKYIAIAAASTVLIGAAPQQSDLTVNVEKMRSVKGKLQLCLTQEKKYFPDCDEDPNAHFVSVDASAKTAKFKGLAQGDYALAVFHDENANENLDTFAGIPKEGIGFSRNPSFTFGPPKFSKVIFRTKAGANVQNVKMKYFL